MNLRSSDDDEESFFACFSEELKNVGISALNRLVQKNGGWPMAMSVKEWQIKGKPWQRISDIMMGNMFSNGLYGIIVQVDDKKSSNHVIFVCILFKLN